jgi:hypothetical protein
VPLESSVGEQSPEAFSNIVCHRAPISSAGVKMDTLA